MLVFHSPLQAKHQTKQFVRNGSIVPTRDVPARAGNILAELDRDGHQIVEAAPHGPRPISAIHTPEYLDFLESAWSEWRKIDGASEEVMPYVFPVRGMNYGYPTGVVGRAGYHAQDLWMPIGEHTWEVAQASANLATEAAHHVLEGERMAYALCRPSGHHAFADMAGGNCVLNNAAIAAQQLRGGFDRVAIVDIDVHHGNGTQGIFYRRRDVLVVSLHRDPIDYHPFFCGYAAERGEGEGLGFNLNLPLPARSGDDIYLAALETACQRVSAYGAGALVISLGVDGHEDDPTAGLAITYDGFRRIGARLAALNLPTVLVQEGGYNTDTIARCVGSTLRGFEGKEISA